MVSGVPIYPASLSTSMATWTVFMRLNRTVTLLPVGSSARSRNNAISLDFHRLNSGKPAVYVWLGTQRTGMQQTALPDSSTTATAGNRRQLFRSHVDHSH